MAKHYLIIGAGISGLSLAWFLKTRSKEPCRITIVEKSDRVGGWIQTIEKDGFLFELGPRSCRPKGAGVTTLQLIKELGLQDQIIWGDATNRYILRNQKLEKVPTGLLSFFTSPLTRTMIPALVRDLVSKPSYLPDESIYDFFSRRFSPNVAETLIDPMVSGIYASDPRLLSMKSCFPIIHQWEQEKGSVLKGAFTQKKEPQKGSLFSFKNGMETLPRELGKQLKEHILLSKEVKQLRFYSDHAEAILSCGTSLEADHIFSTIPAHQLPLEGFSERIPATTIAAVNLGYKKLLLPKEGFGYLVPRKERERILGVVFDSSAFSEQNRSKEETRLTVMIGEEYADQSEQKLLEIALDAVVRHLKITQRPDAFHVTCAKKGIPKYLVGHTSTVDRMRSEAAALTPHLTLLGNSFDGIAVNDCVKNNLSYCDLV